MIKWWKLKFINFQGRLNVLNLLILSCAQDRKKYIQRWGYDAIKFPIHSFILVLVVSFRSDRNIFVHMHTCNLQFWLAPPYVFAKNFKKWEIAIFHFVLLFNLQPIELIYCTDTLDKLHVTSSLAATTCVQHTSFIFVLSLKLNFFF